MSLIRNIILVALALYFGYGVISMPTIEGSARLVSCVVVIMAGIILNKLDNIQRLLEEKVNKEGNGSE